MISHAARHAYTRTFPAGAFEEDAGYAYDEIVPGERIGPLIKRGGRKVRTRAIVLLLVLVSGWAVLTEKVTWPDWSLQDAAAVFPELERFLQRAAKAGATASVSPRPVSLPQPAKLVEASPPAPPPPQQTESRSEPAQPLQERPLTTAALPPSAPPTPQPESSPASDPADPFQARALAVGLHPGLSRVLLERLSPTDYENARIAIQTAVAETPDAGVLVWPKQRKPELALFHVRFVPGAAPTCRRYVVKITKDGWTTTALPMEKCGAVELERRRRG